MTIRNLILAGFLLLGASVWAAGYRTMKVDLTDGTSATVALSETVTMTFADSKMLISDSEGTADVSIDTKQIVGFSFTEHSSVEMEQLTGLSHAVNGKFLIINGINAGTVVSVYDINGISVASQQAVGDSICLDLGTIAAGLYVVTVNDNSFKISLR